MKFVYTLPLIWTILILFIGHHLCKTKIKKFKSAKFQIESTQQCNVFTGPISPNDKQTIISAHNWYRNEIALQKTKIGPKLPFAKNMIQVYWSDTIAVNAQRWANNCKFAHSSSEFRKTQDFPTGENIYEMSSSTGFQAVNWNVAITAWFNEISNMAGKNVDSMQNQGSTTGHFTQVVWANSYMIGCGFAQYMTGSWYTSLYICEYGPVGNVIGEPIYSSSSSAVCVCPSGTTCGNSTFPGLCCPTGSCSWDSLTYPGPIIPGTVPKS